MCGVLPKAMVKSIFLKHIQRLGLQAQLCNLPNCSLSSVVRHGPTAFLLQRLLKQNKRKLK
jgi:hypothetical protein